MRSRTRWMRRWLLGAGLAVASLASLGLLAACDSKPQAVSPTPAAAPPATLSPAAAPAPTATPVPAPTPTPVPLKVLKVEPATGVVGDSFKVAAEGLPGGKEVDLQWTAWEGSYVTKVSPDNVEYVERIYKRKRVSLGRVTADAQGRVSGSFAAPEDHGETHDIYAVVDGKDAAKGGFRILRSITISSTKGAVGEPITITVKGMAPSYYQSTMAVRWDNNYTGFISTVTTKGTGIAQIRAAGPVGDHILQVYPASHGVPYLNSHEGPNWHIFGHLPDKFVYTVTEDKGAPEPVTAWPEDSRVAKVGLDTPRTTAGSVLASPLISTALSPASGPILSKATLQAKGLFPNAEVELQWVTARGNRASASGWELAQIPLGKATTGADGSLRTTFEVPDDLGGWHTVRVVGGGTVLTEASYYLERSLLQVTPKRVKAGEKFTIQMKGIGWTELDNGIAVTYDNSFVGYACGFNSNGNITLYLIATGGPGTHLIDIYPMIYEGHPNKQVFNFEVPQLTALEDNPSLAIGYRLPIFRLAIEVVR